jgi:hypothetical protein
MIDSGPCMLAAAASRKSTGPEPRGRCTICRTILVTEGTETGAHPFPVKRAHIVSAVPDRPGPGALPDHDVHGDLILLCARDHKRADDQAADYTVAPPGTTRRGHDRWIAGLGEGTSRPRLVPDPARPAARALRIVAGGSTLWDLASGSDAVRPSWPGELNKDQHDLIAASIGDARDWGRCALTGRQLPGRAGCSESPEYALGEHERSGPLAGARIHRKLLTGGARDPHALARSATAVLARTCSGGIIAEAVVRRGSGRPLGR